MFVGVVKLRMQMNDYDNTRVHTMHKSAQQNKQIKTKVQIRIKIKLKYE